MLSRLIPNDQIEGKKQENLLRIAFQLQLTNLKPITINACEKSIWKDSNKHLSQLILNKIEGFGNIQKMEQVVFNSQKIIGDVAELFYSSVLSRKIFPNLLGNFCKLKELKLSKVIDDLKNSGEHFGTLVNDFHESEQFRNLEEAITEDLLSLLEYMGTKIKASIIDPQCVPSAASLTTIGLHEVISKIEVFLRDKNNFKQNGFNAIYFTLQRLSDAYRFKGIREFESNRPEMYYAISTSEEKKMIHRYLTDTCFKQKVDMIDGKEIGEVQNAILIADTLNKHMNNWNSVIRPQMLELLAKVAKMGESMNSAEIQKCISRLSKVTKGQLMEMIAEHKESSAEQMEIIPKAQPENPHQSSDLISELGGQLKERIFERFVGSQPQLPTLHYADQKVVANSWFFICPSEEMSQTSRAVERTLKHLESLAEYNILLRRSVQTEFCNIIENISFKGTAISIVVKPIDSGFVTFKCADELERLKDPNCQVWVDNVRKQPMRVYLGDLVSRDQLLNRMLIVRY